MNSLGIHALVWAGDLTPEGARKVITQSKRPALIWLNYPCMTPRSWTLPLPAHC